jgi:hypothetical protein
MANLTHGCVPASIGGFVYPSDPTLEQLLPTQNLTDRVVIRELIALRESVAILVETSDEHCHRLDAIEASASSGGSEDFPLEQQRDDWRARAERLLTERDEARRERDAFNAEATRWKERLVETTERLRDRNADLQQQLAASRAALEGVVLCERCSICASNARAALNTSTPANTEEASK